MKRRIKIVCMAIGGAISALAPAVVLAQTKISLSFPGHYQITSSTPPGYVIYNFYQIALILGGLLAFAAVIYGGVRYVTSGGNPSSQGEAKEWIWSALLGLTLLMCAYLILNTINPNLIKLDLPSLQALSISAPSTAPGGGLTSGTSQLAQQACQDLTSAGVNVSCSQLNGIQQSTVDALVDLKSECSGDNVSVTSVTGGAHSTNGGCTHSNGYKADLNSNSAISSCITGFTSAGTRADGAPLYKAADGAIFADERTRPSNCGPNCDWTGSHWDMQSCNVP